MEALIWSETSRKMMQSKASFAANSIEKANDESIPPHFRFVFLFWYMDASFRSYMLRDRKQKKSFEDTEFFVSIHPLTIAASYMRG